MDTVSQEIWGGNVGSTVHTVYISIFYFKIEQQKLLIYNVFLINNRLSFSLTPFLSSRWWNEAFGVTRGRMKLKIWENKGGPSYNSACCCNDLNCHRSRPERLEQLSDNLNLFPWQVCWISILIFSPQPSPLCPASELGMIIQWWDLCWQFLLLELHLGFSVIGILFLWEIRPNIYL